MKNLIIDCETLGVRDNAVVPMFAAMVTDSQLSIKDNLLNMIILHPLIAEQEANGATRDANTIKFWEEQPEDVRRIVFSQDSSISIADCRSRFKEFLRNSGFYAQKNPFIWQRGSKDLDWLTNTLGQDINLEWWLVRDIRTAIDVLGASQKQNGYMDADKISDEGTMLLMKLNEKNKAHHPAYDVVRDFVFLRSLGLV